MPTQVQVPKEGSGGDAVSVATDVGVAKAIKTSTSSHTDVGACAHHAVATSTSDADEMKQICNPNEEKTKHGKSKFDPSNNTNDAMSQIDQWMELRMKNDNQHAAVHNGSADEVREHPFLPRQQNETTATMVNEQPPIHSWEHYYNQLKA